MRNATYFSPNIHNDIVATCGEIFVEVITNHIIHSGFFSVLADERLTMQEWHSCLYADDIRIMSKRKVMHHVNVIDNSLGIHVEHRIRRHIIDCRLIYPSLISLYMSFRIDF